MSEPRCQIWAVSMERGPHCESLLVVGDIQDWLRKNQCKPNKGGTWHCRGWRVGFAPVSRDTLGKLARIIGPQSAAAKALAAMESQP